MATILNIYDQALNVETFRMGVFGGFEIIEYSSQHAIATDGRQFLHFSGKFTYGDNGWLSGGTISSLQLWTSAPSITVSFFSLPVTEFSLAALNNEQIINLSFFDGDMRIRTGDYPDFLRGKAGNDYIYSEGGDDTVFGGAGIDVIEGGSGRNYLRGDDGNDRITGGDDFDDLHGNAGNDTLRGAAGDDWVVGGKDNDVLYGEDGHDIVYGNLGDDTCDGGYGNDLIRGGQQNDVLYGGAGDDWLSGDRDSDTISGGTGADIFHTFGDAGIDRVLDFNPAEGDRVQLDPGTTYSVAQVGADTVISMGGGGQMTLVGVNMAALTDGWIFI